ncbi:Protein required for Brome mosaic virus replication [Maudiozyma exigua]|uniref:Protein required for Brome mosaic virus replication n=1 Tax=Maudiozyma exigua TaxID=34358 RepID=A0A9P7B5A6_MAUEX|nr:Protein required for Brome mosaic virus replication [Kazachstania exigua]
MHERKHTLSTSHHVKALKQQEYDRQLIDFVIELIKINDHDTLAYVARTSGIPPQLRHYVWPILLKYHPMCIPPNILSNIVSWDPTLNMYHMIIDTSTNSKKEKEKGKDISSIKEKDTTNINNISTNTNSQLSHDDENDFDIELEKRIIHDLQKYFKIRTNIKNDSKLTTTNNNDTKNTSRYCFPNNINNSSANNATETTTPSHKHPFLTKEDEIEIIDILKNAILNFTNKWSKIYKYESGLAWIALGLAEWFPPIISNDRKSEHSGGPVILSGKKHVHGSLNPHVSSSSGTTSAQNANKDNENIRLNKIEGDITITLSNTSIPTPITNIKKSSSLAHLYCEYPLPDYLQDQLPDSYMFNFTELYERLLLVILHSPDCEIAINNINKDFPSKSSYSSNYFPILSGGDLSFQFQLFFKVFSSILPELFQPLNDESSLQPNSIRSSWLYWWIKCSGARSLQRQDRGRIWDLLLGWRPKPNMDAMNFFLNYNQNKFFSQLYHCPPPGLNENFLRSKSIDTTFVKKLLKNDTFWFPDLDNIPLGSNKFPYDVNVFKELLTRNKYEQILETTPVANDNLHEKQEDLLKSVASSLSNYSLQQDEDKENSNGYDNLALFEYSQVHPHIQVIFIYIAVLQYNEFRLLEFEETEILEFLNNLPMFSKFEDANFRNLYANCEANIESSHSHSHVINSGRKTTMISRPDENGKKSQTINSELSTGLTTRSSSSSLSSISNVSTATNTAASIVYNPTANSNSHMMIEVGNDAKASNSFNDLLTIAGDIWRKWLWKELEESVTNDIE